MKGLVLLLTLFHVLYATAAPNVWDVLRQQFSINHESTHPAVQHQIRWIVSHPGYIERVARQSEPYIYHIVTEIKKQNLPGELALIPMIESSYNPFAYSGVGAAGLWQLMPGTGTELGLKQDWWFDGRRSIGPSTLAALHYLSSLHDAFYQDWLLAFAAYDFGEGALSRLIKSSGLSKPQLQFWSLKVPEETKAYIPRLLALAEIIQNPERYHLQLPDIPHAPYFEEVTIGTQIDLNHAAKLAGISYKEMINLNPGFNRWSTAPNQPYKLLIPKANVDDFSRNLAMVPADQRLHSSRKHASRPITTLTPRSLPAIRSPALKPRDIDKGQTMIPRFTQAPYYKVIHIVQIDETLSTLQKRYGLTEHDLLTWNHLNTQLPLRPGQPLIIWKRSTPPALYVVQAHDTLSGIANRTHTNLRALLALNPSIRNNTLILGQTIRLG